MHYSHIRSIQAILVLLLDIAGYRSYLLLLGTLYSILELLLVLDRIASIRDYPILAVYADKGLRNKEDKGSSSCSLSRESYHALENQVFYDSETQSISLHLQPLSPCGI